MEYSDILQWIGVGLSLIGVAVALVQMNRAQQAAKAAEEAAKRAHRTLTRTVFVSDVASIREATESVAGYLTSERFDSALLRVRDLIHQLSQLQRMPTAAEDTPLQYKQLLVNLRLIRSDLEQREVDAAHRIDMSRTLKYLSAISDDLSGAIGHVKYHRVEGDNS